MKPFAVLAFPIATYDYNWGATRDMRNLGAQSIATVARQVDRFSIDHDDVNLSQVFYCNTKIDAEGYAEMLAKRYPNKKFLVALVSDMVWNEPGPQKKAKVSPDGSITPA